MVVFIDFKDGFLQFSSFFEQFIAQSSLFQKSDTDWSLPLRRDMLVQPLNHLLFARVKRISEV